MMKLRRKPLVLLLAFVACLLLIAGGAIAGVNGVKVGDTVCVEGFVMDQYCIDNVRLIDNGKVTLKEPDTHSVHCLVDIKSCRDGPLGILLGPVNGMYSVGYQVDDDGRLELVNIARAVGKQGQWPACSTCTNTDEDGLMKGFRAEVSGVVTYVGNGSNEDPNKIMVTSARASNDLSSDDICSTVMPPVDPPTKAPATTTQGPDICFSSMNTVEVSGNGTIPIHQLQIGDLVKSSADGKLSRVLSFAHMDHQSEASYVQIHANGLTHPLEISSSHLLIVSGKTMKAREVKVGDFLGSHEVREIASVRRRGLYAPITESGRIVVSGVSASSYVALFDLPATFQDFAAHAIFSPLRWICSINFQVCAKESYTDGISNHIRLLVKFLMWVSGRGLPMEMALALASTPLLIAVYVLEHIISVSFVAMVFLVMKHRRTSAKAKSA